METTYGTCPYCGKDDILEQTTFYFNIPCECCGGEKDGLHMHQESVWHCEHCLPEIPKSIKPILLDNIGDKLYCIEIKGILPYHIDGKFLIDSDLTEYHI
jgi:hypothetical protein